MSTDSFRRGDLVEVKGPAEILATLDERGALVVAAALLLLRAEMVRGRELAQRDLAQATDGLRGELGQAQRTLAEVRALELGRIRQWEMAADSLRRLEAVIAGSATRGAAGENLLARSLCQLPPDLLETNLMVGNKVVEYALRLPGGRFLPIDSKWTSAQVLEDLADASPSERRRLSDQLARDLRLRVREVAKYLDPERTIGLGLLAVPDALYGASPEAHGEGHREGVLVVPYSLTLPFVLAVYRLALRFGCAADTEGLEARLRGLDEGLERSAAEVESRLSRALVLLENGRDALRAEIAGARRTVGRMLESSEAAEPTPAARAD
jgi:DNA recombination protein RmuC